MDLFLNPTPKKFPDVVPKNPLNFPPKRRILHIHRTIEVTLVLRAVEVTAKSVENVTVSKYYGELLQISPVIIAFAKIISSNRHVFI